MLVHVFFAGGTVPRERLQRAAPELDVDGLAELGVVAAEDDRVSAPLRVDEYEGLLLLCDRDPSRPDHVMGMSPSTMLTIAYTPRENAGAALDVGTGSGVQALLAARHSDRVVATDVTPRALWMTELNARLNGIENVETREGSFFEPVQGERFDLVVSNPPYIVSPDSEFLYRDSEMEGDSLCRSLLADLPGLLEPGGYATLQSNWIHGRDEKWWAPIDRTLAGSGCDAFMLRLQTDEPLEYAARWSESHHQATRRATTARCAAGSRTTRTSASGRSPVRWSCCESGATAAAGGAGRCRSRGCRRRSRATPSRGSSRRRTR